MALTWDTTNVLDYEDVCFKEAEADNDWHGVKKGDRILNPVTNALIWHSLNTGIGTITGDRLSNHAKATWPGVASWRARWS